MANEGYFIYNGKFIPENESVISPNNRSFRYGDGFFETMIFNYGKINFWNYHVDRINDSIDKLCLERANHFSTATLLLQIEKLVRKNGIKDAARIRINFFRGDGGLFDAKNNHINYIIQAWDLTSNFHLFKENGLSLGIYPDSRKSCDGFSRIKSNNYLCYAMAAHWAKDNRYNDALLLNQYDRVADSTIANIFIIQDDGKIITPSLEEGCVNGVMRRYMIERLGTQVEETAITTTDLQEAKGIFLTNAIKGMMWVGRIEGKTLSNQECKSIFNELKLDQIL